MALSKQEQLLVEAIQSMLGGKAKLGLAAHEKEGNSIPDESNTAQALHENIEDEFALGVMDLTHSDAIRTAFHKVHSYKYLTDPTFTEALTREFKAMAIPGEQQQKALSIMEGIMKDLKATKGWNEKDAGWHPQLDEVMEASMVQQFEK